MVSLNTNIYLYNRYITFIEVCDNLYHLNNKLIVSCQALPDELGFDFIGTSLVGYTKQSKGIKIDENDFELIRNILAKVTKHVISE